MYSSAFNSPSNLSGSPDPKTGTFSYVQNFGKIAANGGLGPQYDFAMSFGVLGTLGDTNASGLGLGWTFKLGNYNQASNILNLNNGAGYKVLQFSQQFPWILSHKLKDFKVEQIEDEIFIRHKNCDTEVMYLDPGTKRASLTKYIAADGRFLEFTYVAVSGYFRLAGISDSERELVDIVYASNRGTATITVFPKTTEERVYTLHMDSNNLLTYIRMPQGQAIRFEYETHTFSATKILYLLKKITYPTGATEEATYSDILGLPYGAPIPHVPALTKHTKIVSSTDQPIVSTYTYEKILPYYQPGNNYWGNNSGVNWNSDYDNLFDIRFPYEYKSEHKVGNHISKCNYNKFHQVMSTEETHGSFAHKICSRETHASNTNGILADQPTTYELSMSQTESFEEGTSKSDDAMKSFTYDDYGNVLTVRHPEGITETNEYYPAFGDTGCPAHPYDMVKFLKKKTVTGSDGLTKDYTYTYKSIARVDGSRVGFIVPHTLTQGTSVITYTYFEETGSPFQCKRKSESVTIGSKTTTKSSSHTLESGTMTTTETITGYDGLVSTSSFTKSIYSQNVLKRISNNGLVTTNTYNSFGRPLSITTGPGTLYQSTTTYEYIPNPTLPNGTPSIGTCVIEKGMTAESHTFYTGENNESVVYQKDGRNVLQKMSEKFYNQEGNLSVKRDYDYVTSDAGLVENTHVSELSFSYDHWGNVCERKHNNGIIKQDTYDPITRIRTERLIRRDDTANPNTVTASLGSIVTTHNLTGKPTKIETLDVSGKVTGTKTYTHDGFGRTASITTPTGHTAKILEYDDFNRPVKLEHFDGTECDVCYADHSASSLIQSISIPSANYTLGQQEYDGLSRVKNRTVNGIKTEYSYKEAQKKPSRKLNGRGQTTLFDYIPELGTQTSKVATFDATVDVDDWNNSSKVSENLFTYGSSVGKSNEPQGRVLTATSLSGANYSYQYTDGGMVHSITQTVGDQSAQLANAATAQSKTFTNVKSTVGGKVLVQSDGNKTVTREYDQYGELVSTINGNNFKVEQTRDGFGRINRKVEKKYNAQSNAFDDIVQITDLTYDDHSREVTRTITCEKTGKRVVLQNEYDAEDKIVKRNTTIDSVDAMCEQYDYDKKKRITSFEVTCYSKENMLPRNEYDKPFVSQSFVYDVLDNVTHVITKFPNGNINTSTFVYNGVNKQRLDRISNTLTSGGNAYPPVIKMGYDADGNITSMNDTVMTYTVSGRMSSKNGTQYTYDPFDRLVKTGQTTRFFSPGGDVAQEMNGSSSTDFIHHGGIPIGEVSNGQSKVYGVDQKLSVISVTDDSSTTTMTYSPYGTGDNGARIGLNGELKDEQDHNAYHLGDGTRTYWPGIFAFTGPDSYSPFFGGGINPYVYCQGNPIDRSDPSGHSFWGALVGLFIAIVVLIAVPFTAGTSLGLGLGLIAGTAGVVSAGLEVAAEGLEMTGAASEKTINNLRIASFSFGVVSDVFSLGSSIADVGAVAKSAKFAQKINNNAIKYMDETSNFITTGFKSRLRFRPSTTKPDFRLLSKVGKHGVDADFVPRLGKKKFGFAFKRQPLKTFNANKNALSVWTIMKPERLSIAMIARDVASTIKSVILKSINLDKVEWMTEHARNEEDSNTPSAPEEDQENTDEDIVGSEISINESVASAHNLPTNGSSQIPALLGVE